MAGVAEFIGSVSHGGGRTSWGGFGPRRGDDEYSHRTRPGAPQADPTQNKGAINSTSLAGTALPNWDSMFKNKLTGNNPLASSRVPQTGIPHVDQAIAGVMADEAFRGGNPEIPGRPAPPPPLDVLAAGGQTHAQAWGAPALSSGDKAAGWQTGDARSIANKYQTPGAPAPSVSYNWGLKTGIGDAFQTNNTGAV